MSQNNESMTECSTKGKEEARASRPTKKNNGKVELQGATTELGNNVCCYRNERQAEFHDKTTKCIAGHVGRECNKDMRKPVNDRIEFGLVEPTELLGDTTAHDKEMRERSCSMS